MSAEKMPASIWSGSFKVLGIELQCHVLDDGRRIIEADSMERLTAAMDAAGWPNEKKMSSTALAELQAFLHWSQHRA